MTTEVKPRKRWTVPAIAVAIGVVYLVAGIRGEDEAFGWAGLGLMTAVAVATWLISLKSETIEGLLVRGDERINSIDRDATLFSGLVVLLTILGAFVMEIAQGRDGQPYSTLGAIGGLAYILALLWLRVRR